MKILGDPLFAKDENGRLKSRVGTIFLILLLLRAYPIKR